MINGRIKIKRMSLLTVLVILLSISLQWEFAAVKIDSIFSVSVLVGVLIISIGLLMHKRIIPKEIRFCILWMIWMIFVATVIAPLIVGHTPRIKRIAYEGAYFLSLMFFFVVGYLINTIKKTEYFIRALGYASLGVAFIALLVKVLHLDSLRQTMLYLSGERFCGLVGNPNDYMPMALCGFVYWVQTRKESLGLKVIAIFVIVFSFLEAGSKSALLVIITYIGVVLMEYIRMPLSSVKRDNLQVLMGIIIIIVPLFIIFVFSCQSIIYSMFANNPAVTRVLDFLFDFSNNISYGNGSDRIQCWTGAFMQIVRSPIFGVGIGSSKQILEFLGYEFAELTPHSIYLELLAQVGIPLFLIICIKVGKELKRSIPYRDEMIQIERHMLYSMLLLGFFFASDWHIGEWVILGCYFSNMKRLRSEQCRNRK